ncbi:hypothetical protein Tco_1165628 [Tanacetum coccineum]
MFRVLEIGNLERFILGSDLLVLLCVLLKLVLTGHSCQCRLKVAVGSLRVGLEKPWWSFLLIRALVFVTVIKAATALASGSFGFVGAESYNWRCLGIVFSFVLFVLGDSVAICVYMAAATPPPPPLTGGDVGPASATHEADAVPNGLDALLFNAVRTVFLNLGTSPFFMDVKCLICHDLERNPQRDS